MRHPVRLLCLLQFVPTADSPFNALSCTTLVPSTAKVLCGIFPVEVLGREDTEVFMSSDEWHEGYNLERQGVVPSSDNSGQLRHDAMAGYNEAQRVLAMEASNAADVEHVRALYGRSYPTSTTNSADLGERTSSGGMDHIWSVLALVGLLTGVLGGAAANQYGHEHHWSGSTIQWATGGGAIAGALLGALATGVALFVALIAISSILYGIGMAFKYAAMGIWWLVTKLFWPFVIMAGITAAGWGLMFGACRWMGWCSQYLHSFPSKLIS